MRDGGRVGTVILAAALAAAAGCGGKGLLAPGRDEVTQLLQEEANALKRENEKLDPILRVKATWTIAGIDVTDGADSDHPWVGTIRFRIRSEAKDADGSVAVDEFDRRFDYVYTASLKRWIFQLQPSPAAPK